MSICGSLTNFVGRDGSGGAEQANRNEFRSRGDVTGLLLGSASTRSRRRTVGHHRARRRRRRIRHHPPHRLGRPHLGRQPARFLGRLHLRRQARSARVRPPRHRSPRWPPHGRSPPIRAAAFTFLLTWHFPNRLAWDVGSGVNQLGTEIVGNHYAGVHTDAWHAAVDIAGRLDDLEERTVRFVAAVCDSDLPLPVREAALFNVSTLRTPDHVPHRRRAFLRLGGLRRPGRQLCRLVYARVELRAGQRIPVRRSSPATCGRSNSLHATDPNGRMSFRVGLPLAAHSTDWGIAAADGQLGCLVKLYRDWQLSGDDAMLDRLWPAARRTLEFAWIPGGWDADPDGVMEGCPAQHDGRRVLRPEPADGHAGISPRCGPPRRWPGIAASTNSPTAAAGCSSRAAR